MSVWSGFIVKPQRVSAKKVKTLIKIPQIYQSTPYSCGVGAIQSVLAYYGYKFGSSELEKTLKPDSKEGTSHKEMIRFVEGLGLSVELRTAMVFSELTKLLDEKIPVVVLIQAWALDGSDLARSWEHGHYCVAIGYDDNNVYFMDPSVMGHYAFIPIPEFVSRWHDKDDKRRLIQTGIVIKGSIYYDNDEIERLN